MSQNQENKRIAKNTVYLYIRLIFSLAVSLYTSRVILQSLGVSDFGVYNVVGGAVSMFATISASLSVAISRFLSFELGKKDAGRLSDVFSSSLFIQLTLMAVLLIGMEAFGLWFVNCKMTIDPDRLYAANWVLQCSVLTVCIGMISSVYNAVILSYEKMGAYAYISIAEVLAKLGIAISLFYSSFDNLILYGILLLILGLIICTVYITYAVKKLPGCKVLPRYNKDIFHSILGYTSWSVLGSVSYVTYNQGYNLLLNVFFDPIVNAARGISVQVQNAVYGFANNFQAAVIPQIIKSYAKEDYDRMHQLVIASSKYSFFLMLLLSLPLILEADFLLHIWLVEVPPHTVNFVRLILSIITIQCLSGPIITANNATGKIKWVQILTCSVMIISLLACYLVLYCGSIPESIYFVYSIFLIIAQAIRMIIVFPSIKMSWAKYFKDVVFRIILVSLVSLPIPLIVYSHLDTTFLSFITTSLVCFISVITSLYCVGLNAEERRLVNNKLKYYSNYWCPIKN